MALSGPGSIFGMSCSVGYRYWARGSGSWAVRVAKKSARAISNLQFLCASSKDDDFSKKCQYTIVVALFTF